MKPFLALERVTASDRYCPRCHCRARMLPAGHVRFCPASVGDDGRAYCGVCDLVGDHPYRLENANPLALFAWDLVTFIDRLCLPCECGDRHGYCLDCETTQDIDPAAKAWGNHPERTTTEWDGTDRYDVDLRQHDLFGGNVGIAVAFGGAT